MVKAWEAVASGRADFVNGSRFIYPQARGAMRPGNLAGPSGACQDTTEQGLGHLGTYNTYCGRP